MPDALVPETDLAASLAARTQALFECRRQLDAARIERQHLQDAADSADARAGAAAAAAWEPRLRAVAAERDRAQEERDDLRRERDAAWAERDAARVAAHDAQALLGRITASTAWRVTGPARRAVEWLRRR